MKLQMVQDLINCGTLLLISFKYDPMIRNKTYENQESLKVEIKNQPDNTNR